jgi:Squalene-hopene cyclase C-terminal domain
MPGTLPTRTAAAENLCVPFLLRAQNQEGAWGSKPGLTGRTEPTAWAVCALLKEGSAACRAAASRGIKWLLKTQRPNGWWTPGPEVVEGTWATAIASLALIGQPEIEDSITRAAEALCRFQPKEGRIVIRLLHFIRRKGPVDQDLSLHGWSWVPGTASWVIPTSLALILLRNLQPQRLPKNAPERIKAAEGMLLNRICPGGGWNIGNPRVYGAAGIPQVEPTAWALLSLQDQRNRARTEESLSWLESAVHQGRAAGSLGIAAIALEVYGRPISNLDEAVHGRWSKNEFLDSVAAIALAMLALLSGRDVLRWTFADGIG